MLTLTIFTNGHSTQPIEEFADILKVQGIEFVIDVRTIPKSRHNPQYNSDTLFAALHAREVTVMDIMGKTSVKAHTMTPWAHVRGTMITYPTLPPEP
jgi:uncharacterized protein (DUF488 family)